MQLGPYTSKLTFGVIEDDDTEFPRPVVTIAMPTINLMRMVKELGEMLDDKDFRASCEQLLLADVKKHFSVHHSEATASMDPKKKLLLRAR